MANGNGKMMGNGGTCSCVGGGCGCNGGGRHWTFFLLRTLLTILILMVVFWFGVVAGRLGSGRMYMRTGYMDMQGYGAGGAAMPMMRVNGATTTTSGGSVQNY